MNHEIENLAVQAQNAVDVREMFQNSKGWDVAKSILEEMRREAFSEWSALKLNAPVDEVISIRAKEKVIREFLDRLEETVKNGDQARQNAAEYEASRIDEQKFKAEKITADSEIESLRKPLSARISEMFRR